MNNETDFTATGHHVIVGPVMDEAALRAKVAELTAILAERDRAAVSEQSEPQSCRDAEGFPTEAAVLRREWSDMRQQLAFANDAADKGEVGRKLGTALEGCIAGNTELRARLESAERDSAMLQRWHSERQSERDALQSTVDKLRGEVERILGDYADLCEVGLAAKLTKERDQALLDLAAARRELEARGPIDQHSYYRRCSELGEELQQARTQLAQAEAERDAWKKDAGTFRGAEREALVKLDTLKMALRKSAEMHNCPFAHAALKDV